MLLTLFFSTIYLPTSTSFFALFRTSSTHKKNSFPYYTTQIPFQTLKTPLSNPNATYNLSNENTRTYAHPIDSPNKTKHALTRLLRPSQHTQTHKHTPFHNTSPFISQIHFTSIYPTTHNTVRSVPSPRRTPRQTPHTSPTAPKCAF